MVSFKWSFLLKYNSLNICLSLYSLQNVFTYIILLDVCIFVSIFQWATWDSERISSELKAKQLVNDGATARPWSENSGASVLCTLPMLLPSETRHLCLDLPTEFSTIDFVFFWDMRSLTLFILFSDQHSTYSYYLRDI